MSTFVLTVLQLMNAKKEKIEAINLLIKGEGKEGKQFIYVME